VRLLLREQPGAHSIQTFGHFLVWAASQILRTDIDLDPA
jgi:hypothetical protein